MKIAPSNVAFYRLLNDGHIHGLFAFGAVGDLELNRLAFVKRLESSCNNPRVVHENLLAALLRNESVAFLAIEPFYLTFHKKVIKEFVIRSKVTQKTLVFKTYRRIFSTLQDFFYICPYQTGYR